MTMNDVVPSKLAKIELFMETLWVKLAFRLRCDVVMLPRMQEREDAGEEFLIGRFVISSFLGEPSCYTYMRWGEGEKTKTKNQ